VKLLHERPSAEPALVSLHAVLRELCAQGYDRRALAKIRDVLATNPGLAEAELTVGIRSFENNLAATIQSRLDTRSSALERYALTLMALSWFTAAVRIYITRNTPSLVACFDEVVATCLRSSTHDLAPSLGDSAAPDARRAKRTAATPRASKRKAR
jgi:hypothetical protein